MSASDPLLPRLKRAQSSAVFSSNNLGTLNGVYIPCLMNILGIILFMRLSWAVGQAGWIHVTLMFVIGETAALFTVFSMSALISTGSVKGGGSYFLLSRCLGPEVGGAIGVFFYLGYAVGASFYVVSFGTEIVDEFFNLQPPFTDTSNLTEDQLLELQDFDSMRKHYIALVGSVALWLVTAISYAGAGSFAKINSVVFSLQAFCILMGLLSMWFLPQFIGEENIPHAFSGNNSTRYAGFSIDNLVNNAYSNYTVDAKCGSQTCNFSLVFGILFNAVTGIMEGANLSGDLKDPMKSIPNGTIAAVFTASCLYLILIFSFAANFERFTLQMNSDAMQDVTYPSHYITVAGISIAGFSAALGSLFGGARVLQALGKDNLPPDIGLRIFKKGTKKTNEPRRAVIFTFLVAQICTLAGDLDMISPIIASFFLITYATVNLSCFLLDLSGTPNFRPTFRFYSRYQAFSGMVLCIGVLVYLDVYYALYAILLVAFLVGYIYIKLGGNTDRSKDWGDVSQALIYHQARSYIYRLDDDNHPKHWRPSLLLLLPDGLRVSGEIQDETFGTFDEDEAANLLEDEKMGLDDSIELLKFCNRLKRGGLFIVGQVILRETGQMNSSRSLLGVSSLRSSLVDGLRKRKIKAIPNCVVSENLLNGFFNLVSLSGLGGMKPNTVLLPIDVENAHFDAKVLNLFTDILLLNRNLLLPVNFGMKEEPGVELGSSVLSTSSSTGRSYSQRFVNIVVFGDDFLLSGTLSLEIQLAYIFCEKNKNVRMRLVNVTDSSEKIEDNLDKLKLLVHHARIPNHKSAFKVITCTREVVGLNCFYKVDEDESFKIRIKTAEIVNQYLRNLSFESRSEDASTVFFFIPFKLLPPNGTPNNQTEVSVGKRAAQMKPILQTLSNKLPNVIFTALGEDKEVITQKL